MPILPLTSDWRGFKLKIMPDFNNQKGIIPLFVLVAIGVAVLAGGTYIVRSEFIKTGGSGKAALDEEKIQQQKENPQALPSLSPTPKGELTRGPFTYNPPPAEDGSPSEEPGFTIIAPPGWEKLPLESEIERAVFKSPETDKEEMEDNLVARVQPMITVYSSEVEGNLDDFTNDVITNSQSQYTKYQVVSKLKVQFAGVEAVKLEAKFNEKSRIPMYALAYLMVKDGYWVEIVGNGLESAWDKRVGEIDSSLRSFKFK